MRAFAFAVLLCCASLSTADAAEPAAPLRQSYDLQVPVAPSPVRMEGVSWLLYELQLSNFSAGPLRLQSVQVRDGDTGRVLAELDAAALAPRLQRIGAAASEPARALAPGEREVLYLELRLADGAPPKRLIHRLRYGYGSEGGSAELEGATVDVRPAPSLILSPPVSGGPWVAIHHPEWARGHRRVYYAVGGRAVLPGRYAIDWVKLDAQGRTSAGDRDRVAGIYGYGEPVLAVADATVAAVRDDVKEVPLVSQHRKQSLDDAPGNYVALDLGDGRYAFYEHLQPGSVRVAVGQRVRRGQPLGALGFTGDSTGPHLHFHLADGRIPLASDGVPYVFDRFRVIGRYPDLSQMGKAPWTPPLAAEQLSRENERPGPNTVLELGRD
ncbi:M23 family metallopeptidase [Lysobacter silvisoli]|uniref:M23 family peptidase n=1 Tax=Lysobacter silvisoli TaxID=2293254 RepID=A0A371K491_9GAMM|nr:M23 family metallopeptidase [Lysobacter silvisoli]RDZ28690.1 M23 family peptidase [Lysobacter silvisoli]